MEEGRRFRESEKERKKRVKKEKKLAKKRKRKARKKRTLLWILIFVMLCGSGGAAYWLVQYGIDNNRRHGMVRSVIITGGVTVSSAVINSSQNTALNTIIDETAVTHVYSHRGSAGANEHSYDAYDEAIAAGSVYIEQDVIRSSDGVLFVAHSKDAVVMTGTSALYSVMTAEQIDGMKTLAGNKILRLSEVFDRYGKNITYVIDLKLLDETTVSAFETLVEQYGNQDAIIIQCKDTDILKRLDGRFPDMTKLLLCRTQEDINGCLDMPYIDIVSVPAQSDLMADFNVQGVHKYGKKFNVWTIDTEEQIKHAIDLNVDTYFTNNTPLALSIEKSYGINHRPVEDNEAAAAEVKEAAQSSQDTEN